MKIEIHEINTAIKDYLVRTNWHLIKCEESNLLFFAKKKNNEDLPKSCGHSKSKNPKDPFSYDKDNEKFLTIEKLIAKAKSVFEKNYTHVTPVNVINNYGDTNFIGAPIQAFDNIILGDDSFTDNPYFIIQPTIRENAIKKVGNKIGVSSSFITLSTQRINSDLQGYVKDIDIWLGFLSKIGLNLFDVYLYPNSSWDAGEKMKGIALTAYIGKLQIGDFVFINEIKGKPNLYFHDVNFGLERLMWCVNKKESYFDVFTPIPFIDNFSDKQIDLIRTATLIIFSGGKGSGKNTEQVNSQKKFDGIPRLLREIIKSFVKDSRALEIIHLLDFFYNFWSLFYMSNISLEVFKNEVMHEIYFAYNKRICENLGIKISPNDSNIFANPHYFISNCLSDVNRKIALSIIRASIKKL